MTKEHIERTSRLIQTARLLGVKFKEDAIHLPCGRKITFYLTSPKAELWALKLNGISDIAGVNLTPPQLAARLRKIIVKDDKNFVATSSF